MPRSAAIASTWRPETERPARTIRAKLLVDGDHYDDLASRAVAGARVSVWIATANLKTMLVEAPIGSRARARGRYVSFFESLGDLARRGVDVCILHASPPSGPLAREMARLAAGGGSGAVKMRRCPRVHLKMIAIDGRLLYLGSANLTGAGLGAKSAGRRNFEMGIVTDSEAMLDAAQERFDRIWRGAECARCQLRSTCDAPLDTLARTPTPLLAKPAPARSALAKRRLTKPAAPTLPRTEPAPAPAAATSRGSSRRTRRSPSSPP
ncbi:MAG: phospholipase D family protein [Labilithrix sp.]|nr:phospholipase D family protein [Labilithrix sp.]